MSPDTTFLWLFWFCLAHSALWGAIFYIIICRRHLWIRFLDAEESFWSRFGLPKGDFTRRWSESRRGTVTAAVLSLSSLLLAGVCAYQYFHFLH